MSGSGTPFSPIQVSTSFFKNDILRSEPITARAPAFQTTAASFNYEIEASSVGSMLCQAQGYPKPVFRWVQRNI